MIRRRDAAPHTRLRRSSSSDASVHAGIATGVSGIAIPSAGRWLRDVGARHRRTEPSTQPTPRCTDVPVHRVVERTLHSLGRALTRWDADFEDRPAANARTMLADVTSRSPTSPSEASGSACSRPPSVSRPRRWRNLPRAAPLRHRHRQVSKHDHALLVRIDVAGALHREDGHDRVGHRDVGFVDDGQSKLGAPFVLRKSRNLEHGNGGQEGGGNNQLRFHVLIRRPAQRKVVKPPQTLCKRCKETANNYPTDPTKSIRVASRVLSTCR